MKQRKCEDIYDKLVVLMKVVNVLGKLSDEVSSFCPVYLKIPYSLRILVRFNVLQSVSRKGS